MKKGVIARSQGRRSNLISKISGELSGTVADLGVLLPLAFALVVFNGFSAAKLFLFWGLVYIVTGFYFKIPISVQPLKAMAVIAMAYGFDDKFLASTAFFYGLLLLFLAATGSIKSLEKIFSMPLIRGVQVGIGLILAQKAISLLSSKGLFVFSSATDLKLNFFIALVVLASTLFTQSFTKVPFIFCLILLSIIWVNSMGIKIPENLFQDLDFSLIRPDTNVLWRAFPLLILPQLPLTLGNAVYAASKSSKELFGKQAYRAEPEKLASSIGISNVLLGIFGVFPVCHGAGGIAAHYRLGARTGTSTMILGLILILLALIPSTRYILFLIPVPILAALLLIAAWQMLCFIAKLDSGINMGIAALVALISFFTHNLFYALIAGLIVEGFFNLKKVVRK